MIKFPFKISGLFVSFAVVLAALVVGTTYSTFQRDLQLLKVKDTGQYSSTLYEITTNMIRLEYEILSYIQNGDSFSNNIEELGELFALSLETLKSESNQYVDLPEGGQELFIALESFVVELEEPLRKDEIDAIMPLIVKGRMIVKDIENFANSVTVSESNSNAQIHDSIKTSSNNSMLLSFLTVLLSILGMSYFIRLNSQNEMMARKNQSLANRSEASSIAKSRLLSMLSHEIRTPMNGVLGLVSLGLHQKLPDTQRKIMEQIRSSAMELITFLEDMLDFSSLEEIDVNQAQNLIYTSDINFDLEKRLLPVFRRNGKSIALVTDETLPKLIKGDGDRIKQSLHYLLSYISKNSSEKTFKIRSTLFENYWLWRIDLKSSDSENNNWKIGSLMGNDDEQEFIASDTFETAMARGMIESMHGEIRLVKGNVQTDLYRLLIYIPIETIPDDTPLKVYKYPSDSDKFDVSTVLGEVNFERVELHQLSTADLVLCDPDNSSELKKLSELRSAAPNAHIVSVGHSDFSDLYDDVFTIPDDVSSNSNSVNFGRIND